MVDRTGIVRGEPLVLQSPPTVSVFDWVRVLATLVGALLLAVATVWRLLTCVPAKRLILPG